jgi:hypothetical protein
LKFPKLEVGSIHVNPVYPDYFVVFKSEVLRKDDKSRFKFKNYINLEDRDNIQKTMNLLSQNKNSDDDSDLNEDLLFERAIAKMRKDKEFNVGKSLVS